MLKHTISAQASPSKGSVTATPIHPIERLIATYRQQGLSTYEIRLALEQDFELPGSVVDKYLPVGNSAVSLKNKPVSQP